jgi:hypothetical protein
MAFGVGLTQTLSSAAGTTSIVLTDVETSGGEYTSADLIGKTAMIDFNIFSNDGNGSLLKVDDVYLFNSGTGTVTITPGNYLLQIY